MAIGDVFSLAAYLGRVPSSLVVDGYTMVREGLMFALSSMNVPERKGKEACWPKKKLRERNARTSRRKGT